MPASPREAGAGGQTPLPAPWRGRAAGRRVPDPYDSLVPPPWTARRAPAAFFDLLDDATGALRPEMLALVLAGVFALRGRPGRRAGFVAALVGRLRSAALLSRHERRLRERAPRHAAARCCCSATRAVGRALARDAPRRASASRRAASRRRAARAWRRPAGRRRRRDLPRQDAGAARASTTSRSAARRSGCAEHEPGSVVAARKRRVAYYAGAPFVQLRPKTAAGFALLLRRSRRPLRGGEPRQPRGVRGPRRPRGRAPRRGGARRGRRAGRPRLRLAPGRRRRRAAAVNGRGSRPRAAGRCCAARSSPRPAPPPRRALAAGALRAGRDREARLAACGARARRASAPASAPPSSRSGRSPRPAPICCRRR